MSRARDTADQINRVNSSAADATAITVDSSENVMLGKTSAGIANVGTELRTAFNDVLITTNNAESLYLNRLNGDGGLAEFRKDGSVIGTIGTQGSRLSIGSGDVHLNFNASANSMYPISDPAAGTLSSGIVDLGAALATFKDAYLSGGVYLGGTTSTNKLTDYEEGTFTPSIYGNSATGSFSGSNQVGHYTKIGNTVNIWFDCDGTISGASGSFMMGGLPFNSHSAVEAVGQFMFDNLNVSNNKTNFVFYLGGSTTVMQIFESADDTSWTTTQISNEQVGIRGQLTYKV
jgi:hypothetical protein